MTLSGDLSDDYVVEERRPDGRVVLRPDLSVKAMLSRHGERELTPTEFSTTSGGCRATARADAPVTPPLSSRTDLGCRRYRLTDP